MNNSLLIYDHSNGVIMIAVFALVCVILVGVLVNFMTSGKKKDGNNETN